MIKNTIYNVKITNVESIDMKLTCRLIRNLIERRYSHEEAYDAVVHASNGYTLINFDLHDHAIEFIMSLPPGINCKITEVEL